MNNASLVRASERRKIALGGIDARPAAAKNFLTYSLVRLGTDHVDVYRLVGLDPAVPIADTIAAIAEFV